MCYASSDIGCPILARFDSAKSTDATCNKSLCNRNKMPIHLLFVSTNVNNPATRVLTIPELLNLVFSFLDPQFNAANACVCKLWSDIALSVLWRDVHDLWRLVRLLGPLKKGLSLSYVCRFIMHYCVAFTHPYQIHRS
jgi:hypothetical protein